MFDLTFHSDHSGTTLDSLSVTWRMAINVEAFGYSCLSVDFWRRFSRPCFLTPGQETKGLSMQVKTLQIQAIGYLSQEACFRIAKEFGIQDKQQELFNLLVNVKKRYDRYLLDKDHHQRKHVLEQISRGLGDTSAAAAKLPQRLDDPTTDGILWLVANLLSGQGLQKLLVTPLQLSRDTSDARAEVARQIGPKLIVFLLDALRQPVEESLALYRLHKGGRPRQHLYRDFVIQQLGRNYQRLFGKLPTTSRTGHFARFCAAVLEELQCELEGLDRNFPALLKPIGVLKKSAAHPRQRT